MEAILFQAVPQERVCIHHKYFATLKSSFISEQNNNNNHLLVRITLKGQNARITNGQNVTLYNTIQIHK